MRVEQLHFFAFGALLALLACAITQIISSRLIRMHLRVIFLVVGFGFIVVPGHGELIVAPILATFSPPVRPHLLALGGIFFIIWWAAALVTIRIFGRSTKPISR